jgi:DNA-binding NarL/FixJ family response regulator
VALNPSHRARPVRVALRIADRDLRTWIADACEDAGIAIADRDTPTDDASGDDVEIVVADRPVKTSARVIALVSDEEHDGWTASCPDSLPAAWREAGAADVRAVVPADIDAATLGAVVTVVACGLMVMPRQRMAEAEAAENWAGPADGADELPFDLTSREREVLALLAEGASNKEIARALAVSVHTVKYHVASLTEKLGARGRLEAIAIAIRAGLVMV